MEKRQKRLKITTNSEAEVNVVVVAEVAVVTASPSVTTTILEIASTIRKKILSTPKVERLTALYTER